MQYLIVAFSFIFHLSQTDALHNEHVVFNGDLPSFLE